MKKDEMTGLKPLITQPQSSGQTDLSNVFVNGSGRLESNKVLVDFQSFSNEKKGDVEEHHLKKPHFLVPKPSN
jgi:hypothetical protein